jgi:predicted aldo/keto reductase-like oxidoreductase
MKKKNNKMDRRNFIKTIGAAGLGSVISSADAKTDANDPNASAQMQEQAFPKVPKRKLGKTGVEVPVLALGMIFDVLEQQIVLRKALEWGITYWDTADCYVGGNSELGIGKFLEENPSIRKELFIVTKSDARDPKGMQELLERSLERMKLDYIDLYFIHGVSEPTELSDEVKAWVAKTKKAQKIRFFGFSTHKNMPECLTTAAKIGWIDGIMTSYNFRVMQDPKMQAAVDACYKAGVGLVAMKTQARGQEIETEEDKKLIKHFLQKGFTEAQAKVKVVLEDERISSACTCRGSISDLLSNVAVALDKTKLTQADIDIFKKYAAATCNGYCAGCAHICERALPDAPYISEIMRYLMYYKSYGEQQQARELFAKIPGNVRDRLQSIDYSIAEACCPQHLPIGKLVAEAVSKLA